MSYPDKCIRGIQNSTYIHICPERVYALSTVFSFEEDKDDTGEWIEESINWMDDKNAIKLIFSQQHEKKGKLQFEYGAAILKTNRLRIYKKKFSGFFDFERKIENDNKYHGNLLLKKSTGKPLKNMIKNVLASEAEVLSREDYTRNKSGLLSWLSRGYAHVREAIIVLYK